MKQKTGQQQLTTSLPFVPFNYQLMKGYTIPIYTYDGTHCLDFISTKIYANINFLSVSSMFISFALSFVEIIGRGFVFIKSANFSNLSKTECLFTSADYIRIKISMLNYQMKEPFIKWESFLLLLITLLFLLFWLSLHNISHLFVIGWFGL